VLQQHALHFLGEGVLDGGVAGRLDGKLERDAGISERAAQPGNEAVVDGRVKPRGG
jgi:hypothetical protein